MKQLFKIFAIILITTNHIYADGCDTFKVNNTYASSVKELCLNLHNNSWLNLTVTDAFGIWSWTSNGDPLYARHLIQFNLSNVPVGSIINSAQLYLYADTSSIYGYTGTPTYGTNNTCTARRITTGWDSATIAWNSYNTTNIDQVVLVQSSTNADDYTLDIKPFVQYWISNPLQNFGMEFKHNSEGSYYNSLIFHNSRSTDVSQRPTLVICYTALGVNNIANADNELICLKSLSNQLQFMVPRKVQMIEILDFSGKVIYKSAIKVSNEPQKVFVNNLSLASGMYIIKSVGEKGLVSTTKFTIK